jgi:sulfur-oxidizing protein SoxA
MSPALQAMQRDETQNPAMLWVSEGLALWSRPAANGRSCAGCHADDAPPATHPRSAAARYPRFDAATRRPLALAARVDQCRQQHQQAAAQGPDGAEVLALTALLAWQARGQPIAPDRDPRLDGWQQRGERLFQQRLGQLNLACSHCHDQRAGLRLGGALIPQAHPTGVPSYRLEWQTLGSLQRRLRSCLVGVRAEPFAADADEWLALEVFLMRRAAGMAIEGAAVRP